MHNLVLHRFSPYSHSSRGTEGKQNYHGCPSSHICGTCPHTGHSERCQDQKAGLCMHHKLCETQPNWGCVDRYHIQIWSNSHNVYTPSISHPPAVYSFYTPSSNLEAYIHPRIPSGHLMLFQNQNRSLFQMSAWGPYLDQALSNNKDVPAPHTAYRPGNMSRFLKLQHFLY